MSINWGPAVDAELAYRHQQLHADFRRPWRIFGGRSRAQTTALDDGVVNTGGQAVVAVPKRLTGQAFPHSVPAVSGGHHVRAA